MQPPLLLDQSSSLTDREPECLSSVECHPGPYLSVPGAWIWAHARRPRALLTRSTLARIATRFGFDRFSSGSRSAGGNWARGTDWDSRSEERRVGRESGRGRWMAQGKLKTRIE